MATGKEGGGWENFEDELRDQRVTWSISAGGRHGTTSRGTEQQNIIERTSQGINLSGAWMQRNGPDWVPWDGNAKEWHDATSKHCKAS